MSDPQNPVAAAVASELKSLRTRAGLTEDRLSGTELTFDALLGLDGVRALMAEGSPAKEAVVRAVRSVASTIEPTLSIVADACLGLELSAGLIDDADLYARDLGLRRDALLRNWNRLHQLRSVPPPRAPSARSLRLEVEAEALSALSAALTGSDGAASLGSEPAAAEGGQQADDQPQAPHAGSAELQAFGAELRRTLVTRGITPQEVARQVRVPESVVTGWLDSRELPSEADARALDDCLTARGAILTLALELWSLPASAGGTAATAFAARSAGEPAGTLGEVFQQVAAALRGSLSRADDGTPLGWPHDLRQLSARPPTAVSTAYGLRTMLLIEGDLAPDLIPVVENLQRMATASGILAPEAESRAQAPFPEAIALVVDIFHRVSGTADFAAQVASMSHGLEEFERSRPFILTTMLEASLRLRGTDALTSQLVESLLAARRPYGARLLWPEKSEALLIDPAPSLAHTARAVRVLARLSQASPDEQLRDAVDQGVSWLLEQRHFLNSSDAVDRVIGGRVVFDYTRHFTAAWAVKALISAGVHATHPTVSTAISQVWDSYAGDTAALWKWRNGDLPVWMTFDAIEALRFASQAVPARPGR
jgi:hypothetical protein